jgi:hypothetical protein
MTAASTRADAVGVLTGDAPAAALAHAAMTVVAPRPSPWIFSRRVDLLVFVLPALVSLGLCAATPFDAPERESPEWVWIAAVLLVDVAHVWSTAFVTYLRPSELGRHPERYWLIPGAGWALGVVLYALGGAALFWRCLAYLAVFHFVRQQYGWMALYRARARDRGRLGAVIDGAAIYAATLYPLVWWHAHLPRRFDWFLPGDFAAGLPIAVADAAGVLYAACLAAYLARASLQAWRRAAIAWGKHLLLLGTAATWYAGIVLYDDDYAFTLTNVLGHGIPYAALVFSYARHGRETERGLGARALQGSSGVALVRFVACLWALAYLEELLWDRGVWHEREHLFGAGFELSSLEAWLVPLLAVPQLTHYVVDGVFWRRAKNPNLRSWFAATDPAPEEWVTRSRSHGLAERRTSQYRGSGFG